jgi:hypothetical protein
VCGFVKSGNFMAGLITIQVIIVASCLCINGTTHAYTENVTSIDAAGALELLAVHTNFNESCQFEVSRP